MLVYLIRRLGQSLLVVAVMATLVFVAMFAVGDPVDILASPDADQFERDAIAKRLGLDRPLYEQFGLFVWRALHGDLGRSFVYNVPAVEVILQRLPATLELALVGLAFSILIGIPLGVVAGLKPHSAAGRSIMSGSILGFSLPNFWIGLMLILLFAVELRILPAGGRGPTTTVLGVPTAIFSLEGIKHLILPAGNLARPETAGLIPLAPGPARRVVAAGDHSFRAAQGAQ